MSLPPLCRYCGCKIKKRTRQHWFGSRMEGSAYSTSHVEEPTSKAEVERLTNQQVVHLRYVNGKVWGATTWDGESYRDEFFCKDEHARDFGYAAVRHESGLAMPAYHEAIKARGGA